MNFYKAKDLVSFKTGKLDSNAAEFGGIYPFFTCSQETYAINSYAFDTECVLLAGNNATGVFPLKYYKGKFNAYQRTYVIEARDKKIINIKYFYYFLRPLLKAFQQQSTGATTKFLTIKILHNIDVALPSIDVQNKIVAILSAYEDLIENNKKRIQILEYMTEELYKEWFVRFRFPNWENTEFEKGLPNKWKRVQLNSLCDEIKQGIKKVDLNVDTKYIGLEHLSRKDIAIYNYSTADTVDSDKLKFKKLDILFAKIRPYLHKVCLAHFDGICSSDTIVLRAKNPIYLPYILFTVFSETFIDLADVSSNGTKMPRANWSFLQKVVLSIPPNEIMEKFYKICMPMFIEIETLLNQIEILNQQKDNLLPRLISGKLSVEDLDIQFPVSMQE
ncbi:restriction endonuclease subunit S [Acinetobacter pittii]|uniref:restriction endonuclease subunit S n=1 Tax=Acinetobacter pittii TaxID=48296 RepID=UPI001023B461|nr:restriction endonuclease subunit S [Acinetobacter pittii]RZG82272.1 restriction endonuclease subunit S [Acinetobacter pittii]RZH54091.1 restriction endonuclease subunit S [Acinetobacter pittii]RZH59277.1 restriction endonuclease subunit S [Acinetobacter pittii]